MSKKVVRMTSTTKKGTTKVINAGQTKVQEKS